MVFQPEQLADGANPLLVTNTSVSGAWQPMFRHGCRFGPDVFTSVMLNLINNPNINSSWLFRADILYDDQNNVSAEGADAASALVAPIPAFDGFARQRCLVRRLVPRNPMRDRPLDQTCVFYERSEDGTDATLVVYLPHVASEAEMPFYHPTVRGIAYLHQWEPESLQGTVSLSYRFFGTGKRPVKLTRTALHLLTVLHKHGEGRINGYVKKSHHDQIIAQKRVQNRYAKLKEKYARRLIDAWAETTDPTKHVFEDLGIAAFLIELWADMYKKSSFPGFVDIGCGNGLLVYILNEEGREGWGFDARSRKSWAAYNKRRDSPTGSADTLQQLVLLPRAARCSTQEAARAHRDVNPAMLHDGCFPRGTFIVSNHADELTPWTPILAAHSVCPFLIIPCCSHNLTGARYRAPPPKETGKSASQYSSLVAWVSDIARDCGWCVEQELLRIPSTRNMGLLGRRRMVDAASVDLDAVIAKYGGIGGYVENVVKLVTTAVPARH